MFLSRALLFWKNILCVTISTKLPTHNTSFVFIVWVLLLPFPFTGLSCVLSLEYKVIDRTCHLAMLLPGQRFFIACSVQFSRSVVSYCLRPHELQCASPPCPSPTPGVHSNSCPSSQWYHPAISSSIVPFSSCPQSLPTSESVPMSQLFVSGGQSTGVSALASFLPKNTQDWSPLGWTGWTSLKSMGLSRVFSNTTFQKHQFFSAQLSSQSNSHIHTWPREKP